MIEKMKMVCVVTAVSDKNDLLDGLRALGVMHLAERKKADPQISARFADLSKTAGALKEYEEDKKAAAAEILSDQEFEEMYAKVQKALDRKAELISELGFVRSEIERLQPWGSFSVKEIRDLQKAGYDLHIYRLGKKEYVAAVEDASVKLIRLSSVDKMDTVAVLGKLPASIPGTEFTIPEKGIEELKNQESDCQKELEECNALLKDASRYEASFNDQMLKAQNRMNYSAASETAENDNDLVWISGYVPEADLDAFKEAAAKNQWAWAVDDVAEDDDQIPTKVRYNKLTGLIKPVFDILGILPGYREQDVSLWFLLFFTLFFAMIIGDAGYGSLILLGTAVYAGKTKKFNNAVYLLLVLSVATIIWGALTGTWFGSEAAMKVPFLKALVYPKFANYPEYFNLTSTQAQNNVMKFSFTIGAIQIALGALLAIKKKIAEKNLSWVSDLGWMIAVIGMYLLVLNLVIGESISLAMVGCIVGAAFLLVVLFGGMSPDKTFAQGLKAGLADAFTVFLNTISCFGNVMSYIRLFAVGMAGLAIAQSFNNIAAGFKGPLIVVGMLVVIIGHALNIVMAFLSVVVHGVRLNVLEFSGQVGLEWTGIEYEPFKKNDKIKK